MIHESHVQNPTPNVPNETSKNTEPISATVTFQNWNPQQRDVKEATKSTRASQHKEPRRRCRPGLVRPLGPPYTPLWAAESTEPNRLSHTQRCTELLDETATLHNPNE